MREVVRASDGCQEVVEGGDEGQDQHEQRHGTQSKRLVQLASKLIPIIYNNNNNNNESRKYFHR